MIDIQVTTEPTEEAVDLFSVADLKKHLRIETSEFDDDLTAAIEEAIKYFDGKTGILNRTILSRHWTLYLPCFPDCDVIELPYPPVTEINSVTYLDNNGIAQTFDADNYIRRDFDCAPAELVKLPGISWPSTAGHPRSVSIEFTAGYSELPADLRRAIKFLAAHYYDNPDATTAGQANATQKLELGLELLISTLTVPTRLYD